MATFFNWLIIVLVFFILLSIKIVRENERLAILRFGRFFRIAGPGLVMIIPFIEKSMKVNLEENLPGWQALSSQELEQKIKDFVESRLR